MNTKTAVRNNYLNWLRVIGILIVFIYHSTRLYNMEDWHVKNPLWYPAVELWNLFATPWMMPLMFAISGASLFYALGKGGLGRFLKDKVLRLLLPLLVADLTHISLQIYLDNKTHGLFSGSYLQFLPHYYRPDAIAWGGMHLWYLKYLFIFSLILYPLLRWFKGGGNGFLSGLAGRLGKGGLVYLLALPISLLYLLPSEFPFMDENGGYPYLMYLLFILWGFVITSDERLQESLRRWRWVSLSAGLTLVAGFISLYIQIPDPEVISPALLLAGAMRTFGGWMCVLAFFGLGRQYMQIRTPRLEYANEAVLPFYILHQTVLLAVGYFVVQWRTPDALDWAVIVLVSFAIIMVSYEFVIRRWNALRFLFGMKRLQKRQPASLGEVQEAGRLA